VTRLVPLRAVAKALGDLSPDYVRQIASDQGRLPSERRYPEATHRRFPPFTKDGNGKSWVVPEQTLIAHLRRRGKQWSVDI
jgi:hypothetical protein